MAVTDQIKDAVPDTIKDNVPTSLQEAVPNTVKEAFGSAKEAVGLDGGYSSGGPSTKAARAEMSAAKLPLAYRDSCAHLLIPLNKCRPDNWYMPWRCVDERHSYEKCQYDEFKLRVQKMDEIRAERGGARSN